MCKLRSRNVNVKIMNGVVSWVADFARDSYDLK